MTVLSRPSPPAHKTSSPLCEHEPHVFMGCLLAAGGQEGDTAYCCSPFSLQILNRCNIMVRIALRGFPGDTVVKNLPANAGDARDVDLIPGSGRSPGVGNGNPPQYSCLENSMDRGAWLARVQEVTNSQT